MATGPPHVAPASPTEANAQGTRAARSETAGRAAATSRPDANAHGTVAARSETAGRAAATSRSEARNAAVRATLTPLAAGERPWPLKIATLLALLIGVGDLVEVIFGGRVKFGGTHAGSGGIVLFSVLMLVCAVGMWRLRYWAVLGFQAILAFVILLFSLLLIRASNIAGFAVSIVVVGGGGFLFYKLVRVLSRLQMPKPPGR